MTNADQNRESVRKLAQCYGLCVLCAAECLDHYKAELNACIKLCQACAEACALCMRCAANNLSQTRTACAACAEICDACAVECGKGGGLMKECADACRDCAAECRRMAA